MIEYEYKYMLDRKEYLSAVNILNKKYHEKIFIQTNYYYDTQDFKLHKNNIVFRVRVTGSQKRLQIKLPIIREGPLRVKNEYVTPIFQLPPCFDLEDMEFNKIIKYTGIIKVIGKLTTERRLYEVNEGIQISLDKNTYLGKVDYELEVEFEENYKEETLKLINDLPFKYILKPSPAGKRNRFFIAASELQYREK